MKPSVSYHDYLIKRLKDPDEALLYLKAARLAKLNRENLYRMLSKRGRPQFHGLEQILSTMGFRFAGAFKRPQR